MNNLKILDQNELKDWAKNLFAEHNFKMIDVSQKKETYRKALATGKIIVGKETFDLIRNKQMPKGDPITLAEVAAVLGVKKNCRHHSFVSSITNRSYCNKNYDE